MSGSTEHNWPDWVWIHLTGCTGCDLCEPYRELRRLRAALTQGPQGGKP